MSVVIQLIPNQSKQEVNGTVILPALVFPGCTIHCMHAPIQWFQNALAYFAKAVSYACKMFMKLAPGASSIHMLKPRKCIGMSTRDQTMTAEPLSHEMMTYWGPVCLKLPTNVWALNNFWEIWRKTFNSVYNNLYSNF